MRSKLNFVLLPSLAAVFVTSVSVQAAPASQADKISATYVSSGPIGVNPFLQLISDGLTKAGKDCSVTTKVVESPDTNSIEDNFRAEIEAGTDLIVANSFESVDAITKLGKEYPNQKWAIVDSAVDGNPNVRGILFKEHEGMFLIGTIFGKLTKTNVIGFVGAIDIPLIRRWFVGFQEGVKYVNPKATVLEGWGTSFSDPATSKELALAQLNKNADYIAAASAAGNTGIFEAAKDKNFFTSGVDTDQRVLDPAHIIESMVKRTDVGVYDAVCDLGKGNFSGGIRNYGLKENGVGPAFLILDKPAVPSTLPKDLQDQVRAIADKIKSGEIVVTDFLAQPPPTAAATSAATAKAPASATAAATVAK